MKLILKRNYRSFFPVVLFLCLMFMGLQSYSNIENGDSLLFDFPRDTMNLGTVNEGEIVPFSFTVKNNYETIVYVSQVYPSCGCTKAEIDTFYLYPQESKKLNFNFDSNGRPGMNYRIIRVFTEKGLFDVRFKVNVIPKE